MRSRSPSPSTNRRRSPVVIVPADRPSTRSPRPDTTANPAVLYVTGIAPYSTHTDLKELFQRFGPVEAVEIVAGASRGTAHVLMRTYTDAMAAISDMDRTYVNERSLRVRLDRMQSRFQRTEQAPSRPPSVPVADDKPEGSVDSAISR